jgi:uncharacterized protein (TIGR02594 family)
MATEIGRIFPDMRSYCDQFNHDAIPWCGLTVAYTMAKAGIRPPFGDTDTDRFLWARSWGDDPDYQVIKTPRLGCVVVLTRSGGGHVSLYESTSGSNYMLRGGNQSDAIGLNAFPKSNVLALVWPREGGIPPPVEPPSATKPVLRKGSTGPDVAYLQTILPKEIDGIYGSTTEALVKAFQRDEGLEDDGICGPDTWAALLDEEGSPPAPTEGWIHGVTATVFGSYEGEQSAYGGELDDSEPFVALPDRFEGVRPTVEVMNEDGTIVEATIEDVGPWMISDCYWQTQTRPVAEQCFASKTPLPSGPQKGRVPSNPAGIDLSPALAKSLGVQGMGKVSWRLMV